MAQKVDIDALLTEIAKKHLHIETLETRRSDSLDFHDCGVGCIKDALLAAYQAGANSVVVDIRNILEKYPYLLKRVSK